MAKPLSTFLAESTEPVLSINQFPHVVAAIKNTENSARTLDRFQKVIDTFNEYIGKEIPNATYQEVVKYWLSVATEKAMKMPEWVYQMNRDIRGQNAGMGVDWMYLIDGIAYPHTIPGKLKKAIAARSKFQSDPNAKKYFDYFIPIMTELSVLSVRNELLKARAVKRQPKPVEDRQAKFIAPMSSTESLKLVLKVLTDVTTQLRGRYEDGLTEMWTEDAEEMNAWTPEKQYLDRHSMRSVNAQIWSMRIWEESTEWGTSPKTGLQVKMRCQKLMADYKATIRKEAEKHAKFMQEEFLFKNSAKLRSIIDLKNVPIETPHIIKLTAHRGTYEGDIRFTFKDGASFMVRNKIIWKRSNKGTLFNQYPTTFHDVVMPDGKPMSMPSEERMNRVFTGITPTA